jgi:hypothetical protein
VQEVADLLRGIAALLWPLVTITAIFMFRREVSALLTRLRKAKFLGGEVELDESLDRLERSAEILEANEAASPQLEPSGVDNPGDVAHRILDEASRSPKVALMLLSAELEREVRQLLASLGGDQPYSRPVSLRWGLEQLARRTSLPRETLDALGQFIEIRNLIVHGRGRVSDDEILRAIDSGLVILKAIQAIPHETHSIRYEGVELFADHEGTQRPDCSGVRLESVSAGGVVKNCRIFPTTCTHFKPGMRVSWEWNSRRSWGETWYRDPESNEPRLAWSSSTEFVGRDLDNL